MSSHGLFTNFGARRFPKDERKALWCARRRIPVAPAGPDAPTTARKVGLLPRGGAVLSFEAKESTKESQRHGDYEDGPRRCAPWASACGSPFGAVLGLGSLRSPAGKRLLLPILTAGLAMSRAMELDSFHLRLERARARLFPPSKWAGLFPSAAYRRSAPPQLALGRLKEMQVGMFRQRLGGFAAPKSELLFFFIIGTVHTQPTVLG